MSRERWGRPQPHQEAAGGMGSWSRAAEGGRGERRPKFARARGGENASRYDNLQSNPMFRKVCVPTSTAPSEAERTARPRVSLNLLASDGRGRLFAWDSQEKLLLYVDVQHSDSLHGTADNAALFASKTFKVRSSVEGPELGLHVVLSKDTILEFENRCHRNYELDSGLLCVLCA